MKINKKIIASTARGYVNLLIDSGMIEVEKTKRLEAEMDVAAVLLDYVDTEAQLNKETERELMMRDLGSENFLRVKKSISERRKIKIGKLAEKKIAKQIIEVLYLSKNIEEIYGTDEELEFAFEAVLLRYERVIKELDVEIKKKLKHLIEGSSEWDIEYLRVMNALKKQKGLL